MLPKYDPDLSDFESAGALAVWPAEVDPKVQIRIPQNQFSENSITDAQLSLDEYDAGNWPMDVHTTTPIDIGPVHSDPEFPSPSIKRYVRKLLSLDLTSWWTAYSASSSKGFFLDSVIFTPFPNDDADAFLGLLSSENTDLVAKGETQAGLPTFSLFYGFPVTSISRVDETAYGTLVTWTASDGADYYLVQLSTDGGANYATIASVTEPKALVQLVPSTSYRVRVASGYSRFGTTAWSPYLSFTTSSVGSPTANLVAPTTPVVTPSSLRGQVKVDFPTAWRTVHPRADQWQVARQPGTSGTVGSTTPTAAQILTTVSIGSNSWLDRYPGRRNQTYKIRARVDALRDLWTPWSSGADTSALTANLRTRLDAPNSSLEIGVSETLTNNYSSRAAGAVETSYPERIRVKASDQLELIFVWRSYLTSASNSYSDAFRWGFRWYDRDGFYLSESYQETVLNLVNGEPPGGIVSYTQAAPSGAALVGIFFEMRGVSTIYQKVRIESLELYRQDPTKDSGWEYVQLADSDGKIPDKRKTALEQDIFVYEGSGWAATASPPPGSFSKSPYREATTAGDQVLFAVTSQYIDLNFYASSVPSVVEVSRLHDSAIILTSNPEEATWVPVIDPSVGTISYSGAEMVKNPDAEANISGWTGAPPIGCNFITGQSQVARQTSGAIAGSYSFTCQTSSIYMGTVYTGMYAMLFTAGKTYKLSFSHKVISGGSGTFEALFGFSDENNNLALKTIYIQDYEVVQFSSDGTTRTLTIHWTPPYDADRVWLAIRNADGGSNTIMFDSVSVQQAAGYVLPTATDFTLATLSLPPWFSASFPTAYRLRLVSGKMRPQGITRDEANVIDQNQDFQTMLRSISELRNLTEGELEFRPDLQPKTVYHHEKRGRDHSKVADGLDLRRGKNLTINKKSSAASMVINRLLIIGYGDDRTQLAHEVRSVIDRRGRTPTDDYYRYDDAGRAPSDPAWDRISGGTSEEVYGVRYGKMVNPDIRTTYMAQDLGQKVVERVAWPQASFDIAGVDLSEHPAEVNPGDILPFRWRNEVRKERVVEMKVNIANPRLLQLTMGEDPTDIAAAIERLSKDTETTLSAMNSVSGTADV